MAFNILVKQKNGRDCSCVQDAEISFDFFFTVRKTHKEGYVQNTGKGVARLQQFNCFLSFTAIEAYVGPILDKDVAEGTIYSICAQLLHILVSLN